MDDNTIDSMDHIKESIKNRKRKIRRKKRARFLRRLFKLVAVISLFVGLFLLDKSEYSRLRDIRIVGNELISKQEILDELNIKSGDRMITNSENKIEKRLQNIVGLDTIDATIYYKQGILNLKVSEKPKVGFIQSEKLEVLYSDGSRRQVSENTLKSINGLPLFVGFTDEQLSKDLLNAFSELNPEILLTISEVHIAPESYDKMNMKLVMNNNYLVFSSISALPLLRSYASIIDRAEPDNRCIYLLEYGPTSESQIATAKRCDE